MTALAADKYVVSKKPEVHAYPVADGIKIYKGSLVCLNPSTGYAVVGADTASYQFIGFAEEQADNTVAGHTAGGITVRVRSGEVFLCKGSGFTQATIGNMVYIVDSDLVGTSVTNYVAVGLAVEYVSSSQIWVMVPPVMAPLTGITGLTATAVELNRNHSVTPGTARVNSAAVLGATKNLDTLLVTQLNAVQANVGAATAEAEGATTTVDVTKTYHRVATDGGNFSGATNCAASAAGNDGDVLVLEFVNAASNGTTTVTFTTNFKPSATLAVTQAHYGIVVFISNGTTWHEVTRSAIIAS